MSLILRPCGGFVQRISKQMHVTVRIVLLRNTAIYIGILTYFAQSTHTIEKHWLLVSLFNCFWFDLVLELCVKCLSHKFDFVAYRCSINIALLETEMYVFAKWYSVWHKIRSYQCCDVSSSEMWMRRVRKVKIQSSLNMYNIFNLQKRHYEWIAST